MQQEMTVRIWGGLDYLFNFSSFPFRERCLAINWFVAGGSLQDARFVGSFVSGSILFVLPSAFSRILFAHLRSLPPPQEEEAVYVFTGGEAGI
jgi:hypothetical protein